MELGGKTVLATGAARARLDELAAANRASHFEPDTRALPDAARRSRSRSVPRFAARLLRSCCARS
jgi:hypothetical protein